MKMRKMFFGLLLALSAALIGCSAQSGTGTLKVGVRDDIVGLGYLNPTTNEYYGFEIDLAKRLAPELGYAGVEFVSVNPENRKEMLLDGKVDCLIAAYSISDSRRENFDFSPSYFSDHTCVMVEKSSMITGLDGLVGRKTGVLKGADTAPVLSEKMIQDGYFTAEDTKGSSLEYFDSYAELSLALEEGRVDAACMDGGMARAYMQDDRILLDDVIAAEEYGVATQKGSALSGSMADAVQKLLDDGTVAGLIDKWD